MAMRKGVMIDTIRYTMEEVEYDDSKRIDGMFYKAKYNGKEEIIASAYLFPIESREKVATQLNILKGAKKNYDDIVANVYYKVLPTLR